MKKIMIFTKNFFSVVLKNLNDKGKSLFTFARNWIKNELPTKKQTIEITNNIIKLADDLK